MTNRSPVPACATSAGASLLPLLTLRVNKVEIIPVVSPDDIRAIRQLFEQYAAALAVDLCFQNFQQELKTLPGDYASPRGALFLARVEGVAAGCIGLRPFSSSVGEVKRLYVNPAQRGQGLARALVSTVMDTARQIGYDSLVLDTLASMKPAIALYESFGFQRTAAYYPNPLPEVVYFRLSLSKQPIPPA
jgi:ribosomal protein S18 acetylase RimI-like enzyme